MGEVAAALYTIRSERQLMEQLQYNLLYGSLRLGVDDPVWVPTVFTNGGDRLQLSPTSRCVVADVSHPQRAAPIVRKMQTC